MLFLIPSDFVLLKSYVVQKAGRAPRIAIPIMKNIPPVGLAMVIAVAGKAKIPAIPCPRRDIIPLTIVYSAG
jgi:hypothetical protein